MKTGLVRLAFSVRCFPQPRWGLIGLLCLWSTGMMAAKEPENLENISWPEARERADASTGVEKEKWEKLYRTGLLEAKHGGKEFYAEHQKERVIWRRGYGHLLGVFKHQAQLSRRLANAKIEDLEARYVRTRDETLMRQRELAEAEYEKIYARYREDYWPMLLGLAPSEEGAAVEAKAKVFDDSVDYETLMRSSSVQELAKEMERIDAFAGQIRPALQELPRTGAGALDRDLAALPEEELSR